MLKVTVVDMGKDFNTTHLKVGYMLDVSNMFISEDNKILIFFYGKYKIEPCFIEVSLMAAPIINKELEELFNVKIDENGDDFIDFTIRDMTKEKFSQVLSKRFEVVQRVFSEN